MGLKDVEGEWISDPMALAQMVQNFHHTLFTKEGQDDHSLRYPNSFLVLPGDLQQHLSKPFSKDEDKKALFDMTPYKVPCIDGFHAGFFQGAWPVVGDSLCAFVLLFLHTGCLPEWANDILLVWIPKVACVESNTEMSPISICNICYKVITKTLANTLKKRSFGLK